MPAKRSKMPLSTSATRIRKARIQLGKMTRQKKIELMVEAGVMSKNQAERAKQKLAETAR